MWFLDIEILNCHRFVFAQVVDRDVQWGEPAGAQLGGRVLVVLCVTLQNLACFFTLNKGLPPGVAPPSSPPPPEDLVVFNGQLGVLAIKLAGRGRDVGRDSGIKEVGTHFKHSPLFGVFVAPLIENGYPWRLRCPPL